MSSFDLLVTLGLLAIIVTLASAAPNCNGGIAGPNSRVVYDAQRRMGLTTNATDTILCRYNTYHRLKITIDKIEISGPIKCTVGGAGDFQVVLETHGGASGAFRAKIWASGPDVGEIKNPSNPDYFSCIVESRASCC